MRTALWLLVGVGGVLWLWRDSMRARELAANISRSTCKHYNVQFLDDTVSLARISLATDRPRGWRIRRVYEFDYSVDGSTRGGGSITVDGDRVESIYLPEAGESTAVERPF